MKKRGLSKQEELPLLYYKTREEIEAYRKKPVELRLRWLESQMEFFHKAMSSKAKRIREKFRNPGLKLSIRNVSLSKEILKERKRSKR
jgi:diketogulonate reductase-like aldo/keto reductase